MFAFLARKKALSCPHTHAHTHTERERERERERVSSYFFVVARTTILLWAFELAVIYRTQSLVSDADMYNPRQKQEAPSDTGNR